MKFNISFIKPTFPDALELAEDVQSIIESNWFTNFGPYENKFRERIKEYLGDPGLEIVTVSNATVGIDIAVRALLLDTPSKKEVIVPSFTFAAGPEVLISHGLTPVFIDIDRETWQPSLNQAKEYLVQNGHHVSGILLGNTFGVGSPEITNWELLAEQYGLPLIIDSAAGFGSRYEDGSRVGTKGTCEVFSFHATKPFAVGEGGAVVTHNKKLAQALHELENFGFNDHKEIISIGTNAKLEEISCAIGVRQLETYEERLKIRQSHLKYFQSCVVGKNSFQENDIHSSVPFMSVLLEGSETAIEKLDKLNGMGIMARKYYAPLHDQPVIMKYAKTAGLLTNTEEIYSRIIAFPLHDTMSEETIGKMAALV